MIYAEVRMQFRAARCADHCRNCNVANRAAVPDNMQILPKCNKFPVFRQAAVDQLGVNCLVIPLFHGCVFRTDLHELP